jgi:enamine deaminase RidA (YjgF/YER057c/UK114 family)
MGVKRVLRPAGVWDPSSVGFDHPQPFSQGMVRDPGRMVFVAGQVALDPGGNVIGVGDPAAQTEATSRTY